MLPTQDEEGSVGPLRFSADQTRHLMSRGLGDILCDNTRLSRVPDNVFRSDTHHVECGRHQHLQVELLLEQAEEANT